MPIYDYVCDACGHRFEVLHGLNESGPHQCPVCGGHVKRAFAPPAIVFKGSGWAKVDRRYSGAPQKRKSEGGEPTAASTGAASEAKGESAAAAEKPSKPTAE